LAEIKQHRAPEQAAATSNRPRLFTRAALFCAPAFHAAHFSVSRRRRQKPRRRSARPGLIASTLSQKQ